MHSTEVTGMLVIVVAIAPILLAMWAFFRVYFSDIKIEHKSIPGFGEFQVLVPLGTWMGSWDHPEMGKVGLFFDSHKDSIPDSQLQLARDVLDRLPELVLLAVSYYAAQPDTIPLTTAQFGSVHLHDHDDESSFSLAFEFDNEHRTFVLVPFRGFQPTDTMTL